MLNRKITPDEFEDWKCIYETNNEHSANLLKGLMQSQKIPCEILSKKDSAYQVNLGDLSLIFVYVPKDHEKDARQVIADWEEGRIALDSDEDDMEDSDENES